MHVITQSCLLFIWVHTLNVVTAADCKLEDFINGRNYDSHFDTSGLEQSYVPGAQVRVPCQIGFVGFFKLRCLLTGWTHVGNKCEPKSCGHPGDADFAEFSLAKGDDFVFGAEVQYTCQRGYQMVSRISSRRCGTQGWDGFVPVCQPILCPVMDATNDVQIFGDREEATYGNVLRFSCKSRDLVLKGVAEIECDENGVWSDKAPTCIEVKCTPPKIDNGIILDQVAEYNKDQPLRFQCDSKFKRSHHLPSKCTRVGMRADWIPTPLCDPVHCTLSLTTIPGTRYEPDDGRSLFSPDDTVKVLCDSRYFIVSHSEQSKMITCQHHGEWEISPVCEEITCNNHPRHETGVGWTNDHYGRMRKLDDTVTYTCSTGYKDKDVRKTATCTRDGWAPQPLCEEIKCKKPDIPNAEIEDPRKMEYSFREKVRYICSALPAGRPKQASCTGNGWNPKPKCEDCKLEDFINGRDYDSHFDTTGLEQSYVPGAQVRVPCQIGFVGSFNLRCLPTGWTHDGNKCEPITRTCTTAVENGFGFLSDGNVKLFYTCNTNYKRFYKGWWGNATCNDDGAWNETPQCIGIAKCGEIPQIPHAEKMKPENDDYTEGKRFPVVCKKGYNSTISEITCTNGDWNDVDYYTICKPIENTCEPPPKVKYAIVMCDYQKEYLSGTVVQYKCRNEYKMEGEDKIKCKNGDWEEKNLKCIRRSCPRLDASGDINIKGLPDNNGIMAPGHNLTISCRTPGKKLLGSEASAAVLTCGEDEEWNPPIPSSCEDVSHVTCPRPPADDQQIIIEGLPANDDHIQFGHQLRFRCSDSQKQTNGQSELTCGENGKWNHAFPSCEESNICGAPPSIEDGDLRDTRKDRYDNGEEVHYDCPRYYKMIGGPRTCHNGRWIGDVTCLKPCTVTQADLQQYNMRFSRPSREDKYYVTHNDQLTFVCKVGYRPNIDIAMHQKCINGKITLPSCSR